MQKKSIGEDKKMKRWICIAMMIMMAMTAAAGIAEETIRQETDGQDPMGGALITRTVPPYAAAFL